MRFKEYYYLMESMNSVVLSVDVQPEYFGGNGFNNKFLRNYINKLNSSNNIICLYNGYDTLGMITENDYKMWLIENGLDEEKLDSIIFYDKGYAFFRYCMDSGIDEDDVVELVRYMYENDINDSRDLKDRNKWDDFIALHPNKTELRELLEFADDCINIPDLMEELKKLRGKNIELIGGGREECLKEVEIALKALNIPYKTNDSLIYEKTILTEMPVINNIDKEMNIKTNNVHENLIKEYKNAKRNHTLKLKQKINEFEYELYETDDNDFVMYVLLNSNVIGMIGGFIKKFINKYNFPQISALFVYKDFNGKGIATNFYKLLIDQYGGIVSDKTLTDGGGSYDIWVKKLIPNYHFYVYNWTNGSISKGDVNRLSDYMKSKDYRFIASKNELTI